MQVSFDSRVFSLEAIKKAAYKYIDRFLVDISLDCHTVHCDLKFMTQVPPLRHQSLIDDFRQEVLDQDLREKIRSETAPIRNLIFAHAFSKIGTLGDDKVPDA